MKTLHFVLCSFLLITFGHVECDASEPGGNDDEKNIRSARLIFNQAIRDQDVSTISSLFAPEREFQRSPVSQVAASNHTESQQRGARGNQFLPLTRALFANAIHVNSVSIRTGVSQKNWATGIATTR